MFMDSLSPIILFVYNRLDHTRKTVEALKKNEFASDSVLYVFADGPKTSATPEQINKVNEVQEYIKNIEGFKEVHTEISVKNKGLANSVIAGVTKVVNQYGKVIVVEDDIVTHPFFLRFMNDCLNTYKDRHDIFMIGGYSRGLRMPWFYKKDIYAVHRSCSWGWATWKDRWALADWNVSDYSLMCQDISLQKKFNRGGNDMFPMLKAQMQGKIDSWAIRWDYCMYKHDALCVIPVKSMCYNIGFDGSGVHCGTIDPKEVHIEMYSAKLYDVKLPLDIRTSYLVQKRFKALFSKKESLTVKYIYKKFRQYAYNLYKKV